MERKVEVEKKYQFKNLEEERIISSLNQIINDLKLVNVGISSYEDIYYDNDDILEAYKLTARKRTENGVETYSLKKDQESTNNTISREKYEFESL